MKKNTMNMESVTDKFLRYVSYDTQSDDESVSQPSTAKQLILLNLLVDELRALGISDARIDKYGYVMATVPSNIEHATPVVGFLAHVDTSPDMPGANVNPQIIKDYDGGDIVLNKEKNVHLSVADFPEMKDYKGQTLITTDGTTLLGADDKAGVAEIMWVVQYLQTHPDFKHGTLKIGFTPDEEIGRGVVKFDVAKFGADYAYTFDGGPIGELEYENFNAASAQIRIQGKNIHPGYAKNRMLNAIIIAMELNALLPPNQRPEHTSDYEGFYLLVKIEGTVENAELQYIIRDHDRNGLERKKSYLKSCVELLVQKYGDDVFYFVMCDQYYNMREKIEPHFHIVETARKAMEEAGVMPLIKPIRGGTDGARLSYMGLPCPNIFAGGHNFHGKYEFIPVESMEKACEVMINIIKLTAKK
ncbi:MAG: peptidase T [Prevotellaceae bacterium]|jgi:tripeptide aminopeptidase|nr:peptidase T [Prevotellaceae bacterium]